MLTTYFWAQFLGLWMLIVGLALLRRPEEFRQMAQDFMSSRVGLYLGGLMALALGLLITLTHNVWELSWPLIITIIGWLSLIKGALLTIFPDYAGRFSRWYLHRVKLRIFAVAYIFIGLYLCWVSFI